MREIDRKYVFLIGTPLSQSFADRMQNRAYEAMGLNMHYSYIETDSVHLREIVTGLKHMPNVPGFAVTKPNKVKVIRYLDELEPLCEKIGACNTVVKTPEGRLRGYNTDAEGFLRSVRSRIEDRSRIFCIGSGGAARAICFALAENGAERIYLTAKHSQNAAKLARDINSCYPGLAKAAKDFGELEGCDTVINASGVGMGASEGTSPAPRKLLHKGQFCFDACYNPLKTRFLLDAEERGCKILNGLEMSLYQGARQIELWTGFYPPIEAMKEEILK